MNTQSMPSGLNWVVHAAELTRAARLMHDIALVNTVAKFATELDRHGIAWCVMRNHETFPRPRSDTSDFDLMLACKPSAALNILKAILQPPVGLGMVISRSGGGVISVFITLPGSPALRLDFMNTVSWAGRKVIATEVILANRRMVDQVPIPAPGHEVADSLMTHLFHNGHVKDEYRRPIQKTVEQNRVDFTACLAPVWGQRTADQLATHAASGDWAWFGAWVRKAKWRLLLGGCLQPVMAITTLWAFGLNIVHRILHPPGLWIAFLGPDGAGKTTVGDAYRTRLLTLFYAENQRHLHWRPSLLPAPGKLTGRNREPVNATEPHGKRSHGPVVSLLRFFYFWLDYVFGHWLRVRPILAKGGLVTFDRYFQDFRVDSRRYRLSLPGWLLRLTERFVPQPELLFVMDAPAEVLHSRKQELSIAEITAQLNSLRQLTAGNPAACMVRVDRSVEEIVDILERESLDYLNKRNRRRLAWDLFVEPAHV
jgi:thymidylate kinase